LKNRFNFRFSNGDFLYALDLIGAPRPMKMGNTPSLWRYDSVARPALQSVKLRRTAMLHFDLTEPRF
jgi:hypothetical protein